MALTTVTVLWVVVTAWVARDASWRHRWWFGWAALVWFTNIIGLGAWLIARRRFPVVGERPSLTRSLALGATAVLPLLLIWLALSALIVTYFFQVQRVVGHAMEPVLEDQERVMVNVFAYRLGDPQMSDVVLMRYPPDPSKLFVKRVIARAGDTVRGVNGLVSVNGVPLSEEYVSPEFRGHDDWGPHVVPQGFFFVLGDHRNNSSDSRHWGFVPKRYIIGKVIGRFGGARGRGWRLTALQLGRELDPNARGVTRRCDSPSPSAPARPT